MGVKTVDLIFSKTEWQISSVYSKTRKCCPKHHRSYVGIKHNRYDKELSEQKETRGDRSQKILVKLHFLWVKSSPRSESPRSFTHHKSWENWISLRQKATSQELCGWEDNTDKRENREITQRWQISENVRITHALKNPLTEKDLALHRYFKKRGGKDRKS